MIGTETAVIVVHSASLTESVSRHEQKTVEAWIERRLQGADDASESKHSDFFIQGVSWAPRKHSLTIAISVAAPAHMISIREWGQQFAGQ
jgi:hypothetical protein